MTEAMPTDTVAPSEPAPAPALPPNVAKAITEVMAGVTTLAKDEKNPFARYMYAGIESYLDMVRPLCATAGLIILQDEDFYEFITSKDGKDKTTTWLVMSFLFTLAHSSGETWTHRMRRTAMVQASMGSQAFGAAQSYALKSYLRAVGMIATGDTPDADTAAPQGLPARNTATNAVLGHATLNKKQSDPIYKELILEMRALTERDALRKWWLESRERRQSMHPDYQRFLLNDAKDHETAIEVGVDEEGRTVGGEATGDEIPEEGGGYNQ